MLVIGIYRITNLANNKIYIGQSIDIEKRVKDHFYKAFSVKDSSYPSAIHNAIRKYGKESFVYDVLEECSMDELDSKERYYIDLYNSLSPNGYNMLIGGRYYKKSPPVRCRICNKEISKYNKTGLCIECYKDNIPTKCPDKELLKKQLFENNGNFSEVGRIYDVSSNAIAKWCRKLNMPFHSNDYKI